MDPENNNGIISDLLTFVMEKESHKKVGKAWTRCYVLYEPPGTDRSSLIGAMANYLKFDIYNVDLMNLSSISELQKVLGSTRNYSLIAIQDYNLWHRFPQPKNQLTVPCLLKIIDNLFSSRGDEHIIVFTTNHRDRHDAAPVDMDMHIYTSSPRPSAFSSEFADTNHGAHLVRQDQGRSTASHSDKKRTRGTSNSEGKTPSISLEVLQQHFGSTRKQAADNLEVSVSTLKRICRQHGIERWQNRKRNKVSRPPDQYGERNTSTACEAPPHNVQTGIEVLRPPDPHGEKNPSPTFKTPSTIGQITVENEMGSQNPEPNEFQLDSFEDMNFRNTETGSMAEMPSDWEDLLALEEEPFPERNVSGSIYLTVVACSDTTPGQQPMPTIPDTMPPNHMMPHLACSDPAPCQQPMLTISDTMPTIRMLPHFAAREDMRFYSKSIGKDGGQIWFSFSPTAASWLRSSWMVCSWLSLCAKFWPAAFLRSHSGEGLSSRLLWSVVAPCLTMKLGGYFWVFCCVSVVDFGTHAVATSVVSPIGGISAAGCYIWEQPDRLNSEAGSSGGFYGSGRRCS